MLKTISQIFLDILEFNQKLQLTNAIKSRFFSLTYFYSGRKKKYASQKKQPQPTTVSRTKSEFGSTPQAPLSWKKGGLLSRCASTENYWIKNKCDKYDALSNHQCFIEQSKCTLQSHSIRWSQRLFINITDTAEKSFFFQFRYVYINRQPLEYAYQKSETTNPVPREFSVQDLKFFISYMSRPSDLKLFFSCLDKNLKIWNLKFGSEIEVFRNEITLKNKISDLKLDLKNFLFDYNWRISRKQLRFNVMLFLLYTIVQCWFKLSGQNEQNLNFQTRFSQIGLRLDKKWRD